VRLPEALAVESTPRRPRGVDCDIDSPERWTDRSYPHVPGWIGGHDCRGFGQPLSFEYGDACASEQTGSFGT
jgi:hypothetical protein